MSRFIVSAALAIAGALLGEVLRRRLARGRRRRRPAQRTIRTTLMTRGPSTAAMIAARRADATRKEAAVEQALSGLVRRREPVTISGVADRAGVSRSYLSRHPTLGPKVRAAGTTARARPTPAPDQPSSVEAALRHHIRGLQVAHQEQLAALRTQLRRLEHENASLRGELLACDRDLALGR